MRMTPGAYDRYVTTDAFEQFERRMDERWQSVNAKLDDIGDQVTVLGSSQVARTWLGPRGTKAAGHLWAILIACVGAAVAAIVTLLLSGQHPL